MPICAITDSQLFAHKYAAFDFISAAEQILEPSVRLPSDCLSARQFVCECACPSPTVRLPGNTVIATQIHHHAASNMVKSPLTY